MVNDFKNSIDLLRTRDALQEEDIDLSTFPPVLNVLKLQLSPKIGILLKF